MKRGLLVGGPLGSRSSRAGSAAAAYVAAAILAALIIAPPSAAAAKLGNYSLALSMAPQPNGRIVVAGATQQCDPNDPFVACADPAVVVVRFKPGGKLDRRFGGGDGLVKIPVGGHDYTSVVSPGVPGLAIQDDGKIVVGAATDIPFSPLRSLLLVRLRATGKLDRGFGDRGEVVTPPDRFIASEAGNGIVTSPDGSILVAGSYDPPGPDIDFAAARYLPDGTLDPGFGAAGVASINVSEGLGGTLPYYETANAIGLRADGRIVLGGRVTNGFDASMAAAQLTGSGQPDESFGSGGRAVFGTLHTTPDDLQTSALALAIEPDGSALFAGSRSLALAIARLSTDGALDEAFGDGGVVSSGMPENEPATDLALDGDEIVVTGPGRDIEDPSHVVVARYHPDGSLDQGFAGGTGLTHFLVRGLEGAGRSLTVAKGGRILVAGDLRSPECAPAHSKTTGSSPCQAILVLRVKPNGRLDRKFGRGGIVTTPRISR